MKFLSLFSGIEAASVAWKPLGWECVGVAEIEPFPCAVLAHYYPGVQNLGDVTKIDDEALRRIGPFDVLIGGSPCQDLSVAGKRGGLTGVRSGLFHEQVRIFHAARHICGARILIWENVPGAFSSNEGRDFAVVVGAMAGCELTVPAEGWGTEGVALGRYGLVEWSVLDAQWSGVAQRRRRVFAVLDVGDWSSRPPILLEPESLRGDSAPRRETRKGITREPARSVAIRGRDGTPQAELGDEVANAILTPNGGRGGVGVGAVLAGDVAHSLRAQAQASHRADSETYVAQKWPAEVASTLNAHYGEKWGLEDHHALNGAALFVPIPFDTTQITSKANGSNPQAGDPCHPLTHAGDAPAIVIPIDMRQASRGATMTNNRKEGTSGGAPGTGIGEEGDSAPTISTSHTPAIAIQGAATRENETSGPDGIGVRTDDTAFTLEARSEVQAVAFGWQNSSQQGASASASASHTPSLDKSKVPAVAIDLRNGTVEDGPTQTLQAAGLGTERGGNPNAMPATFSGMKVRRLTPRECERLQGFEDDYTLIPVRGKPAADGPRYKALGNSFAVPVIGWIGRQIEKALAA